jgi:hypothetical protein
MCGRMQLVLADDVREVRLLRTIPFVVISVPANIDSADLKKSLSQWLDATQRRCAMSLWESHSETDPEGSILMCEPRG